VASSRTRTFVPWDAIAEVEVYEVHSNRMLGIRATAGGAS